MRVLAVTPYYAPEGGGLERYAHAVLSRLAARGHAVTALSFTRQGQEARIEDGVRVLPSRAPVHVGNTPLDPRFVRAMRRAIDAHRPDVVVAHTPVPYPAAAAFWAAERSGVPFVTTYHAGRLRGSGPALDALAWLGRRTWERHMLAGSAGLIAVGPYVRDHALGAHRARVDIVPPGVDAGRFRPDGEPDLDHVLFVGPLARAYRWKGVDVLWSAFERVHAARPQARLTLVGDGDRRASLAARAARSGLPVALPGRVQEPELARRYAQAGVVVLPSLSDAESFGMVLAEANASGRPVVGSRIGGIPDFVRHGENGLLVPPGDAGALAKALLGLMDEPERAAALGARGRARVVEAHDWERLTDRTEAVLARAATTR